MTDDDKALVARLRDDRAMSHAYVWGLMTEAADRIEALSAENERLQFLCDLNAVPAGIIEDRGRMEERAAIVAWLRGKADEYDSGHRESWPTIDSFNQTADAIEQGSHLK